MGRCSDYLWNRFYSLINTNYNLINSCPNLYIVTLKKHKEKGCDVRHSLFLYTRLVSATVCL